MKRIIVCADDYGLNEAISQGIRQLVTKQRLSAVSCVVHAKDFELQAQQLLALNADIDIGLHLNLSEGRFLTTDKPMPSLKLLLVRSQLHWLKPHLIEQEINAQLDKFLQAFGRLPDFVDGHQHVHHLPVIRKILLKVYEQRLRHYGTYLRSVYPVPNAQTYRLKSSILAITGAYQFKRLLEQQAIPHNTSFLGIYDFASQTNYRALWIGFLARAQSGALIMCHPGLSEQQTKDSIAQARLNEYRYFNSDDFVQDCHKQHIRLVRYSALATAEAL